ncbi:MAG: AAA family ATPase [Lachnospiraceae bacterium]|nr:AAA family ATPase [Lachnospiraceae bacterium]
MEQPKKIVTRMCLSNWGGISHKILEFHEYINLFSGMSGSGKSTVMDAIQILLYGSMSSNFLNKAADDAKNKRSVFSYLRGEQKDGSANRANQDFRTIIALEIKDTGLGTTTCVGAWFEVHKNETELKKYYFFSHSGKMPDGGYLNEEGLHYSFKELQALIESRQKSRDNRGRGEVNRIYNSLEAYTTNLNDVIFGFIDGGRFRTMQKSAIALKMTNGTGQFIRDYMFTRSEGDVIETLSEQLGAYREIKEKIDDVKKRIDLLTVVQEKGLELVTVQGDAELMKSRIKCVDIMGTKRKIEHSQQKLEIYSQEKEELEKNKNRLETEENETEEELVQVKADIQSSDLGSKKQHLEDLEKQLRYLAENSGQWRGITAGLQKWCEDETAKDYVSNYLLEQIESFLAGNIDENSCEQLKKLIKSEEKEIDDLYLQFKQKSDETYKELQEKQTLVNDMQNNRKTYSPNVRQAKELLERKLGDLYGKKVPVHVFADLFDIVDEEWKNAIEGRMGSVKYALITEPQYAHNAAELFKGLKRFEDVTLIHSDAIVKLEKHVMEHSLYEAVSAEEDYVDECLKHYIGKVIKCKSVDELEKVRDGVTPDCYAYSNFRFRHLRQKDYTTGACIGRKVSKKKLQEYMDELETLQKKHIEQTSLCYGFKAILKFENLERYENALLVSLSRANKELEQVLREKQELEQEIRKLSEGEYKQLEQKKVALESKRAELKQKISEYNSRLVSRIRDIAALENDIRFQEERLSIEQYGYVPDTGLEQEVEKELKKVSGNTLAERYRSQLEMLNQRAESLSEELTEARMVYVMAYPACGFTAREHSNDVYMEKLNEYQKNYEPQYQEEFDKQCGKVYQTLKENIVAKIHNDIKQAMRHKNEINRMLKDTNFGDSVYQIKIEAAKTEDGQFYDMLTARELDTKNVSRYDIEGQLSFGDDEFYQKYEKKLNLLMEKFMPPKGSDESSLEASRREMEKYADYRTYLHFNMYEQVEDEHGVIRENYVDEMAGRDSGGEGQNPKYVALLAGFAMLYMDQSNRDSRIKLVLLDEAFSKMDQKRSEVCLKYARKLNLQLIVCVPDERLSSLIRNVDCVYGFRRDKNNQISMLHIDKGNYLELMEG